MVFAMNPRVERLIAETRELLLNRQEAAKVVERNHENEVITRSTALIQEGLRLRREAGLK